MAKLTKRDVAINLLFWLMPWPLSKNLPNSLQIAYYGPSMRPDDPYYPPGYGPGDGIPDPYSPWPTTPTHPTPGEEPMEWDSYLDDDSWECDVEFY